MPISVKTVSEFVFGVPWAKVFRKVPNTPRGHRLHPSKTPKNDSRSNFRVDMGSEVNGKFEIVIQANKNAENRSVRDAANKNSHAILAKVVVDPKENPTGEGVAESILDAFKGKGDGEDKK